MSRATSSLHLSSEEISLLLNIFPQGLVAVDLETTGLSPLVDKIIEIAAIKITPQGKLLTFHELINPLIPVPPLSTKFHGLINEDLKNCSTIKKPLKIFWEFIEKIPMIAHNATFDLGHLIKASHDHQLNFPPLDIYDSCRYTRSIFKNNPNAPANFKLSTLMSYFGLTHSHHLAMEDAFSCLKVMSKVLSLEGNHPKAKEKSYLFRLSEFYRDDCFNFSTRFKILVEMVQNQQLIEIIYQSKGNPHSHRPLRPIGLLPLPKGPVLFGECLLSGKNKSFLLKKIKSYKKLEASLLLRTNLP